ncbi:MAG: Gfo/Idh/MocA family protein [Lachnospirales bacterium]
MLKVAMLSKWHVHAEGYANTVLKTGKAEITAVWDDDPERGLAWAKELGCDYEKDLDVLLARKDVEAVVCDAPTTSHKDILIKAAKARKHIFTEKSMAPTQSECEEIAKEVEKAGITFTISLPQRVQPVIQFAKKMIDEGVFGKISLVRIRNGHDGVSGKWLPDYWFEEKDTAGGALMDLGCHPMYTATYLLGKPKRVSSIMTQLYSTGLDENASVTIEFDNGAVCTGETSFVTFNTPGMVEIYGTDATLIASGSQVDFYQKDINKFSSSPIKPHLPAESPIPLEIWVDACVNKTGTPDMFNPREGVSLAQLLENAYISNKENRIVEL